MSALTPAVSAWLATHHGVATRDALRRLGLSKDQIQHLVASGVLLRHARCVYRLAAVPVTPEQRAALACAVAPDVVLGFQSAARAWGLRRAGPDRRLHVIIPWGRERSVPGAVVHRSNRLDPADVVERADGIRLTSPPRTAFDAASYLSDDDLLSLLEQVLERHCTLPTLLAAGRRLAGRGRAGSERFTRVVRQRPAWLKPVSSDLELRVELALLRAGLPRPLRQHPVDLGGGEVVHPDFLWLPEREALEVDHVTWHGGLLDRTYDERRDRRLWIQAGIHVTRVTDAEIRAGLDDLVADLGVLLRSRRRQAG